jgi:hypothetical protein
LRSRLGLALPSDRVAVTSRNAYTLKRFRIRVQRDEAWFKREIVPKLDAFSLGEIAAATG